jgi:hypothetical protein
VRRGTLHGLRLLLLLPCGVLAQDVNRVHPHAVVTAQRDGYTIAAVVTHAKEAKSFSRGVALFPGHPGILRVRQENGEPAFEQVGNFLVRARRHWLDDRTLAALIDAPSDQWTSFSQQWRESPRYGSDIEALLREVTRQYGVEDWTYVGTSEGSVSAFHAARMTPGLVRRVILTSSVFRASRNGPGLSSVRWQDVAAPLLWVHHVDDPCPFTAYRDAQEFARRSGKPLVSVRGGDIGRGEACQARTAHGFIGIERETVLAMGSWIRTGVVPADVGR